MELKFVYDETDVANYVGSNRTFMELKSWRHISAMVNVSVLIVPLWN